MSLVPTQAETSPEASVDTITFGKPTGSDRMAAAPIVVLAEPPAARTPSILESEEFLDDESRAVAHDRHRMAPILLFDELLQRRASRLGNGLAWSVRLEGRRLEHPRVDNPGAVSLLLDRITQVPHLLTLGVEAPDYRYRDAHGFFRGLAAIGDRAIYHLHPVSEKGSSARMRTHRASPCPGHGRLRGTGVLDC